MGIKIAEYDPAWPVLFEAARAEIRAACGDRVLTVEHMGSTSVPGLAAKPTIDIVAGVRSVELDAPAVAEAMRPLGYAPMDTGMRGRLFLYREVDGRRTHHLHVVPEDELAEFNELLLRDWLREHPDDAARYGALKKRLAGELTDGFAYTKAKTELIQELVDAARLARGLARVPVWVD
ncbi:GrpB family protein [Allokutzneria oryzae]|uniref:GrpB family protein n=1 Tax=Allokutzneria oryzae TaxID=1378989 RepID=A0ABV5ZYE1_9PSEU